LKRYHPVSWWPTSDGSFYLSTDSLFNKGLSYFVQIDTLLEKVGTIFELHYFNSRRGLQIIAYVGAHYVYIEKYLWLRAVEALILVKGFLSNINFIKLKAYSLIVL
jgi:hypothetical protein